MSKPITRSKQTTEGLLIEPEGESNASSASTVTQVGDSNVALFTFLQHMQDREQRIERDRSLREEERERDQRDRALREEERDQRDRALREEERERDKVFEAILSRIGGDRPGEIPVPSPSSTSISHGGSLKVPPFPKLEPEEDVESYFGAFEAHMEFHDVPNCQWSKYLGPILNPDANLVYMAMDTTARKQYSMLKEDRISQETYRAKMVKVRRKAGESWTTCGNRYLNFCWKWVKDCSTLGDMVEL